MKKIGILIAGIALSLAWGGSALALSCNNCVNSGDIVNSQVKAADIAADSVGNSELVDDITLNSLVVTTLSSFDTFTAGLMNLGNGDVLDIADNGGGGNAAHTLAFADASSFLGLDCADAQACDLTMGETAFSDGDTVILYNADATVVNMADTSGVSELSAVFAMGQWDTITLIYRGLSTDSTGRWIEVSRSDN